MRMAEIDRRRHTADGKIDRGRQTAEWTVDETLAGRAFERACRGRPRSLLHAIIRLRKPYDHPI
jgi:hypothetical protein